MNSRLHVSSRTIPPASLRTPHGRQRSIWSGWLAMAGALVALTLLAAFYSIVSSGVQRAAASREQARAEVERQAMCSALPAASRDQCLATLAVGAKPRSVAAASYGSPSRSARTVSASLY